MPATSALQFLKLGDLSAQSATCLTSVVVAKEMFQSLINRVIEQHVLELAKAQFQA